jgi:hypothetical protein
MTMQTIQYTSTKAPYKVKTIVADVQPWPYGNVTDKRVFEHEGKSYTIFDKTYNTFYNSWDYDALHIGTKSGNTRHIGEKTIVSQ